MNFILILIFGALVGWLSSLVLHTNNTQGLIGDIVLGIIGSLVGGFVMGTFGEPGVTGFNMYSLLVGIIGAVVFVWVGRFVTRLIT